MLSFLFILTLAPSFFSKVTASEDTHVYFIKDTYCGEDFLHSWNWETANDPTHGRVNYLDRDTALNTNLTYGAFAILVHSSHVISF